MTGNNSTACYTISLSDTISPSGTISSTSNISTSF